METTLNPDFVSQLRQAISTPIALDQLTNHVDLSKLWRCDVFIL